MSRLASLRSVARIALGASLLLSAASGARPPAALAVHVVRLDGNRFDPAEVRVAAGDIVRFVNGQGGPHNVQFMAESTTVAAQALLDEAMKDRIAPLTSPMFLVADDVYDFVVPGLPPGRYPFLCSPHWANMRGALIVGR